MHKAMQHQQLLRRRPPSSRQALQCCAANLPFGGALRRLGGVAQRLPLPRLPLPLPQRPPVQKPQQERQQGGQQQAEGAAYVVQEGFRPAPVALDGGTAAGGPPRQRAPAEPPAAAPGAQAHQVEQQQEAAGALQAVALAPLVSTPPAAPLQSVQTLPPLEPQQPQQPVQQQQPLFDVQQQLAFARHLSAASNGAAPLGGRMESLSWLLFTTGRAQARGLAGPPADVRSWLAAGPEGTALLERVYLAGGALADLGAAADGLYAGGAGGAAASNGQRAIASLDFASLLSRYLTQHGVTLRETFVAELPCDSLQAKALHLAACLETRCTVHRLVFDRLIDRVGTEGPAPAHAAPAWGGGGASGGMHATTIHNTTITSAAGGAAHAGAGATSSSAANAAATAPAAQGGGPLQVLWVAAIAAVGGVVRLVVAVLVVAGGAAARLLALGALLRAVKAVAGRAPAVAGGAGGRVVPGAAGGAWPGVLPAPQLQPAFAAASSAPTAAGPAPAALPAVAPPPPLPPAAAAASGGAPAAAATPADSSRASSSGEEGGTAAAAPGSGARQGSGRMPRFALPNPFHRAAPRRHTAADAAAPLFGGAAAILETLRPAAGGGPVAHPLGARTPGWDSDDDTDGGW
ncbi:MAG: hypothetical protein J3K34DRAFT_85049 [Monoraphidium minutum]|nr:MAG: hypothetical protein J3K34DRAFT_85049 [Monoraphidium minutum]